MEVSFGEYNPWAQWLKNKKMTLFDKTKRGRTPIFSYVLSQILLNVLYNVWGSMGSLKLFFRCVNNSRFPCS